jgi:hypothetical protein
MNPAFVTYIGFVVAAFILLWGLMVVGRRYFVRKKKVDPSLMNTWVPLKPVMRENPEEAFSDTDEDDQDESSRVDHQARAQQNGHYSESQKKL